MLVTAALVAVGAAPASAGEPGTWGSMGAMPSATAQIGVARTPGATVRVAGRTVTTSGRGTATVELPPGRHRATASKPEYTSASASVRSERRGR